MKTTWQEELAKEIKNPTVKTFCETMYKEKIWNKHIITDYGKIIYISATNEFRIVKGNKAIIFGMIQTTWNNNFIWCI